MTGTGTKEQGPLPPLLLTLTVVTGSAGGRIAVVTAEAALAVRLRGPWRAG